ncbi:MAG TPA: alpha/beta hydrolase [Chitinophagaceae bacterium]|nr:alpha/beta hydrolase [Chitinophagaceae bacterium]
MNKYFFGFLLLVLSACGKDKGQAPPAEYPATTAQDVSYGGDPLQKMDVYLPFRGPDTTKVIILIHGGAWLEGDKSDFNSFVPELQRRLPGYAIFNLNYRLYLNNTNRFPTQEEDIKSAFNFIYSRRNEYHISDKFVLLGASAGGHLALLQGNKYSTPVKPKALVSFFGPVELVSLYNSSQYTASILLKLTGGTPATVPAIYESSSPSNYITPSSPPTIFLQGGADTVVPPSQSQLLQNLLQAANVPNQYVFYPTQGHGWVGADLQDSFDKIAAFIKAHVQ